MGCYRGRKGKENTHARWVGSPLSVIFLGRHKRKQDGEESADNAWNAVQVVHPASVVQIPRRQNATLKKEGWFNQPRFSNSNSNMSDL
jgi:hypothetical protein